MDFFPIVDIIYGLHTFTALFDAEVSQSFLL